MPLIIATATAAELERRRQEGRARPAYRNRDLGPAHARLERYARRVLLEARPGGWQRFYAASAEDAAAVDQCIRYIVRQERPAESVRVEWLRQGGSWRVGFPRSLDRRGHGDAARIRRETRAAVAGLEGRDAGTFGAELARMERVQSPDGAWWYAARLKLSPKRGTAADAPASPRPRASMPQILRRALTGDGQ